MGRGDEGGWRIRAGVNPTPGSWSARHGLGRRAFPADQQQRAVVVDVLRDRLDQVPRGTVEAARHITVGLAGQAVDALHYVPVGRLDQTVREEHQHVTGPERTLHRVELGTVVNPEERALRGLLLPPAAARAELQPRRMAGRVELVV